jgi:hypothetical protein
VSSRLASGDRTARTMWGLARIALRSNSPSKDRSGGKQYLLRVHRIIFELVHIHLKGMKPTVIPRISAKIVRKATMSCDTSGIRRGGIPVLAFGISLSAFIPASGAFACGGIFDVKCNLEHGGLSPGNIAKQTEKAGQDAANTVAKAGQDVANAINELQASVLSGPTLEQAIIASHNTAINGAMPIPPQIRQPLTGYASEDSMNRVRYKIGDNGFANLAHLLEQGGLAAAVTLIDVIVFRGPSEAADPSIWAHELTHVDQYREWGVHSFAVQYARNWRGVEDPAYAGLRRSPTL